MPKAPPLAPELIREVHEFLKDPLATYKQAGILYDIHTSTARRIACGEYPTCPEPIKRATRPRDLSNNVKRGFHLHPDANAALEKFCEDYAINASAFVSKLLLTFDAKQKQKGVNDD